MNIQADISSVQNLIRMDRAPNNVQACSAVKADLKALAGKFGGDALSHDNLKEAVALDLLADVLDDDRKEMLRRLMETVERPAWDDPENRAASAEWLSGMANDLQGKIDRGEA